MRLRDMLKLLEEAKHLEPDFEHLKGSNPPTYRLRNQGVLLRRLERIALVPPIAKAAETARDEATPIHFLAQSGVAESLQKVRREATQLAGAISAILPSEDPLSLAIRIPEPESLEDFEQIVRAVRLVFERTATNFYRGTIAPPTLGGFDVGSQWLVIAGIASGVIKFTFAILHAGASYRQKVAEAEQAEVMIRKMEAEVREADAKARKADAEARKAEAEARQAEADTNFVELYKERQLRQLDGHLDQITGQLTDAFGEQRTDGDQAKATDTLIRTAILTWSDLIQRGAVVRPALNAPPEIADLCPSPGLDPAQLEKKRIHLLTAAKAKPPSEDAEADGELEAEADET